MSTIMLKPLSDRLVVEELPAEDKIGLIVIPESSQERPKRGKVIAAGYGRYDEKGNRLPMEVMAGDEIFYGKYAANEVKVEGKTYLLLKESDILCKVQRIEERVNA